MMRRVLALALACLLLPRAAAAQTTTPPFFPLEITNMDPAGVNGATADARRFRAYPGIPYNLRVAVVGGVYPFTYALSGEPAGMTIDANTGEITWTNPTVDEASVTVTVTDAASATDAATWAIDVTTTGFLFVSATGAHASNNGCVSSCGTGTLAAPFLDFLDLVLNDAVSSITYFRAGTYSTRVASGHASATVSAIQAFIDFSSNDADTNRRGSTQWLGYPGETAVIDIDYHGTNGWAPRFNASDGYLYNLHLTNMQCFGIQSSGLVRGVEVRGNTFTNLGPGGNGENCAYVDTRQTAPDAAYGMVIADNVMDNFLITNRDHAVAVKIYSQQKLLIADNTIDTDYDAIHLKQDARQFTVRGNTVNAGVIGIGGNMDDCLSGCEGALETSYGEITFNNVLALTVDNNYAAVDLNQAGENARTHVYRNTIRGYPRVRNADSVDGPFYYARNVIINPGGDGGSCPARLTCNSGTPTDYSRIIVDANNLQGATADNIVDANGNLQGSYLTDHGPDSALPKGHMLGDAEEPPPVTGTLSRFRFRVPE